ncbi:carboxypeptidase regulatory-like domain-containing protein [Hyalangium gracile]|uniref:carboxypeptidase regulatory-like domain-containing protein n=1 Tax=Hyalangium gracile TaxID=394092 RepID=UPI001CCFE53B|nr:carboxypeptidase regulatory-like domain-containing protein [Hyalangium gracile]
MHHRLHIAMAVVLGALGTGGCGGLANEPFLFGTVSGRLVGADASVARVSVLGKPELSSTVKGDGSFTIERVPAGAAELFIIASATKTLRQPLIVQGGQSVSLGELEPKEASFLSVRVKSPDNERVTEGRLVLEGTPSEQSLDDKGRAEVGPLPDGCYSLLVSARSFPDVSSETCVSAGEKKEVKINLSEPSGGCATTGCVDDYQCAQSGRCVECLEDTHCGPGLSCRGFRCEGGPLCTPCTGDWTCQAGSSCQALPEGNACVGRCGNGETCKGGFTCQSGRCMPNSAQFSGCGGYRGVGASCGTDDAICRGMGIIEGACVEGTCTLRCKSDDECPEGYSCKGGSGGKACRLEN